MLDGFGLGGKRCWFRSVLDDTKEHRTSEDVWGTCTFHESSARSPNRAETVRAHNWVVAGDLIPGKPWTYLLGKVSDIGPQTHQWAEAMLHARGIQGTRVSSQRQAEELTIRSQVEAIRQRIEQDGLVLDGELGFLDEARLVQEMFRWVGVEGSSLAEVVRRLGKRGVPTTLSASPGHYRKVC